MQQPVEVDVDESQQVVGACRRHRCGQSDRDGLYPGAARQHRGQAGDQGVGSQGDHQGLLELADHLVANGSNGRSSESTSDYWRPFFYILEGAGLEVWLVNARQAKNVPGRPKTDKIDAVWLAKLAERSMVTPSFVPAEAMRHVRDLARARFDLVEDRTRVKQRVEKLLEDSLVKIFGCSLTSTA